jgi:hypothetical protein
MVRSGQSVTVDGMYYDWIVYHTEELGEDKKCYIATFAKESIGNYKLERKPYIMITLLKSSEMQEVSVFTDYEFKKNGTIDLAVGNKQFKMFTKGNMAWTRSQQEDRMIIEVMVKTEGGIKIRGETVHGEYTIDSYSTLGLARAYRRMIELCRD